MKFTNHEHLGTKFPLNDDQIPYRAGKPIKLKQIHYKVSPEEHFLTGIRLVFTNGFQTPLLETATAKPKIVWPLIYEDHFKPEGPKVEGASVQVDQDYEIIDIDSTKVIRKVSVLI